MWKAALKGLLAHKLRLISTALAVVIGVAFVAGSLVLTDTMRKLFEGLFDDVLAGVDLSVRSDILTPFGGRERVPEEIVNQIRAVPGVRVAEGGIGGLAEILNDKGDPVGTPGAPSFGVSWGDADELSPLTIRSGQKPTADKEMGIDASTARRAKIKLGDELGVVTNGPVEYFKVVSIIGFGSADNLAGAALAAFDLKTAQRLFQAEGRVDGVSIAAEQGVKPEDLARRVDEALGRKYEVITQDDAAREAARELQQGLGFFQTFLLVFAGIALFVGTFLIFNTFSIILTQRTREFGLLRALGATRSQVLRSVLVEAAILGVVSSLVGLGLGVGFAALLKNVLDAVGIDLPSGPTVFRARTAVISIVVGLSVVVVSAVAPAIRAGRISPVAAMREFLPAPKSIRLRTIIGSVMTAGGTGLLFWGLNGETGRGIQLVGAGAGVMFLGIAIAAPILVRPVVRLLALPVRRFAGMSGHLAQLNAMRDRRRTASTAAALMVGLSLVSFVTIMVASTKASVEDVIDSFFRADFTVNARRPGELVPQGAAERVRTVPGLSVVSEVRRGPVAPDKAEYLEEAPSRQQQERKFNAIIAAVDPATVEQVLDLQIASGSIEALSRGEVLIYTDRIREGSHVPVGWTLGLEFINFGRKEFKIGGTFESPLGASFLVSHQVYDANFSRLDNSSILVKRSPGTKEAEVKASIKNALSDYPQLDIQTKEDFLGEGAREIDQLLNLVRVLLGLAIFVATLGIWNTLSLSILERTRELGMLRAVGMTRAQTKWMVRWEAVFIGLLGVVLGLILGIFFAWALMNAINEEGFSRFVVPPGQLAILSGLAAIFALVAGLWPAYRASRMNVLDAVAAE